MRVLLTRLVLLSICVSILLQVNASVAELFVNQSESSLSYQSVDNLMSGTYLLRQTGNKNTRQNIRYFEFEVETENDNDTKHKRSNLISYHELLNSYRGSLRLHAVFHLPQDADLVLNQKIFVLHESYLI